MDTDKGGCSTNDFLCIDHIVSIQQAHLAGKIFVQREPDEHQTRVLTHKNRFAEARVSKNHANSNPDVSRLVHPERVPELYISKIHNPQLNKLSKLHKRIGHHVSAELPNHCTTVHGCTIWYAALCCGSFSAFVWIIGQRDTRSLRKIPAQIEI